MWLKLKTPKPKNMKKVLLVLAVAGVMVACNNKKKEDKDTKVDTTTTTTDKMDKMDNTTTTGIPTFADAEVQSYVNDYTAWVNAYMDAYKTKDMTKISEYSMKAQDWSSRSMTISQKLANNPDEAKKFSDYMTKLANDMANAAKAMTPQ